MRIASCTGRGRKAVLLLAVMFLFSIVLTACLSKQGEEFVGKWQDKENPKFTAKISRTGGTEFQVTEKHEVWDKDSDPIFLEYKNGRLTNQGGGFKITYNKETATITMPEGSGSDVEWTKIKK